jgi:hypothetical protein
MVNVVSEKCEYNKCLVRPSYNFKGEHKGRFCIEHCLEGMVDVVSDMCQLCDKQATYNFSGETKAIYCVKHCKLGMENIKGTKCKREGCDNIPYYYNRHRYQGYCLTCFIQKCPDEPVARNYKTKEKATTDFLLSHFTNLTLMIDRHVYDGCSKRRPDVFIDMGTHIIIIEIDENAHRGYDTTCDNK